MSLALAITPASPVAVTDFAKVNVTGGSAHTTTGASYAVSSTMPGTPTQYPTQPAVVCYLTFELDGAIRGKSQTFTVGTDGKHEFDNYVFPEAGSWTVRLNDAADDSSLKTLAVTVQ